jgi:SRSO17 transposase
LYLRGLLTDGRRKSMQPMAERLGVDHQGLQQFVTSSTWDHEAVRPPGEPEPTDYWLSNMDPATPLKALVRLAKIRWRIEHDYRELKTGLGLDHFEGRSWTGWHRHVTLASLAQAFITLLRLDPKADAPA